MNDETAAKPEKVSATTTTQAQGVTSGRDGRLRRRARLLLKNRLAVVGGSIVFILVLIALLAPLIAPYGYNDQNAALKLLPPSSDHLMGTDDFGRDIFSRLVFGAQVSLRVGVLSVIGSLVFGTLLGAVAGYYGGWRDSLISRIFDIVLAFPSILLAIAIVAILGPSLTNALIAIATINIPVFGRLVRAKILSLKGEDYIISARSIGASDSWMIRRHLIPNSLAPLIVQATLSTGTAILEAAALGFLGLGAQPPFPEWGRMLSDAQAFIQIAPWTVVFPGIAIACAVIGFNMLGDGLRDVFDPRAKG